jgi:hypothetical protein
MKRMIPMLVALASLFIVGVATADARPHAQKHCVHHLKHHPHRCKASVKKKGGAGPSQKDSSPPSLPTGAPQSEGPTQPVQPAPAPAPSQAELDVRFFGSGGPHGAVEAGPQPLSGEIAVFDLAHQLVAEQHTTEGHVVVPISPGQYDVTVAWMQGSPPCNQQEVTVAEYQQLQVTLECVIN